MPTKYVRNTLECKFPDCTKRVRNHLEFCGKHLKAAPIPDPRVIEPRFAGVYRKGPGGVRYPVFEEEDE